MATAVNICNEALDHVSGKATIAALDEASSAARACNRHYDVSRRSLLARVRWRFATRRATLASVSEATEPWSYAFALPSDFIADQALMTEGQSHADPAHNYAVNATAGGRRRLLCDVAKPILVYTFDASSVPDFPPLFRVALSLELAARIALTLSMDPTIVKGAREQAARAFYAAAAEDGNAGHPPPGDDAPWIRARQ